MSKLLLDCLNFDFGESKGSSFATIVYTSGTSLKGNTKNEAFFLDYLVWFNSSSALFKILLVFILETG